MRYLVTSTSQFQVPPEHASELMDALHRWERKYRESGHIEQAWANAGGDGGGAIVNVSSHDELDAMMVEFPLSPFSRIHVQPLADLHASLDRYKERAAAMPG